MNNLQKLNKKQRHELFFLVTASTFAIFVVSLIFVSALAYFVVRTGALQIVEKDLPGSGRLIVFMAITSAIISLIIVAVAGKTLLKPVNRLIHNMNRLASGDYSARMIFGKPFGNSSVASSVTDSFNIMAEELQNTEMLRSDFINNFSHEFKTPIVSIAGFAKLLKRGNLTEEQRMEYLDAIEEESMRLSKMATNVLNMTKVENQTILSNTNAFNLSEQIRSCFLLFENKWSNKNIEFDLEFDEYFINANEEMLKQVWINLIDNAIKFTPDYGTIRIKITEQQNDFIVSVKNHGSEISPENQEKIFKKFYQEDESHSGEGNGIGLAIVKKIVELHKGEILVNSKNKITTFTVRIPKNSK